MSSVELLHLGIRSHSRGNYFLLLQNSQRLLDWWFPLWLRRVSLSLRLDSQSSHSSEKDFKDGFHIINKHFLEVSLLLPKNFIFLFLPHFKYDTFVYIPIPDVLFEILQIVKKLEFKFMYFITYSEGLRLFLRVLWHPVTVSCKTS